MSNATNNDAIDGLLAAITAMERAQADLDRAVVITGIGALLADDIRERIVRMRIEAQRVKVGTTNGRKADSSKVQVEGSKLAKPATCNLPPENKATVPVSIYVKVRYYGGAYIASTVKPAVPARASSTSAASLAAVAAAKKSAGNLPVRGAYEETSTLWRVELSATS